MERGGTGASAMSASGVPPPAVALSSAVRRTSLLEGGGGSELDPLDSQMEAGGMPGGGNLHGMAKLNRAHFTPQVRRPGVSLPPAGMPVSST